MFLEEAMPVVEIHFKCNACGFRNVMSEDNIEVFVSVSTSGTDTVGSAVLAFVCPNPSCENEYEYTISEW